jgi:hypothetical protein
LVQGTWFAGELHTVRMGELGGTFATRNGVAVVEEIEGKGAE